MKNIILAILGFLTFSLSYYFLIFHEFEYTSIVSMKIYEEPELRLHRYKASDLVLSGEEFELLSASYPKETYISEPKFYFMIEGREVHVTHLLYNNYNEGDTIVYYKGLLFDNIHLD
jgi:hypothetical protein